MLVVQTSGVPDHREETQDAYCKHFHLDIDLWLMQVLDTEVVLADRSLQQAALRRKSLHPRVNVFKREAS